MNIKEIVKDQNAHFVFYRDQELFYETDKGFLFSVPISDAGSSTIHSQEKAIILMRYIRKHIARTEAARNSQNDEDRS